MKKTAILFGLIFLLSTLLTAQQPENKEPPKEKGNTKYFKIFKENFYKEDEFLEEVSDPKEETAFFAVKYNEKEKVVSLGYYTRKGNRDTEKTLNLTQYVNFEELPYYFVTYKYNSKDQLLEKAYKDENDKPVAFYKYVWNSRSSALEKVEKWGKTKYLGKMELKSINEYKWEGEQLKTYTFYNKSRLPVERYYLTTNPNTGENRDPDYLVGNNGISMFVLSKYERFRIGSRNEERIFYVIYKNENNLIIQERYNHDGVLVEELPPIQIPEQVAEKKDNK